MSDANQEEVNESAFVDHPVNIAIGVFLLSWTVFISYPLFTISGLKLKQHYQQRYFQQRGVTLTTIQTIIMCLYSCLLTPLEILLDDLHAFPAHSSLLLVIEYLLDGPLFLALFTVICIRVWLVNYHHKLQLEMADAAWKQQLHAFSVDSASFYTRHKNTLGSLSWMIKVVGTAYIITMVLIAVFSFVLFKNAGNVAMTAAYVVPIAVLVGIWCKFPKFNDNLFIRRELRDSFLFVIASMILGAVLFYVGIKVQPAYNLVQFSLMFTVDGLCYISILRVIRLNKEKPDDIAGGLAYNEMNKYDKLFTMQYVIENQVGYKEFMKFLVHEFASENLCFVTEYCQFRESLNLSEKQKGLLHCDGSIRPAFMDKKSEFQTNNRDANEFLAIVNKLYTKYIASGTATYEINVSYETRMALAVLIDPQYEQYVARMRLRSDVDIPELPRNNLVKTIQIIIPLFEQILHEVVSLLLSIYPRFKKDKTWNELRKSLVEEYRQKKQRHGDENDTGNETPIVRSTTMSNLLPSSPAVHDERREPAEASVKSMSSSSYLEQEIR